MGNKNFIVGVFVSTAVIVFVAATLWLTDKHGTAPTANYAIYFEDDVSGLMLGGPVFYLGVNVGAVTSMDIVPGNPMRVRVVAEVLQSAPINAGTYASLAFQGITGVAVVKLNATPGKHGQLQADPDTGWPVIPVRSTGFSAVLAKAPDIVEKIDLILSKIDAILAEENREFINRMLDDVSTFTSALAANEDTIAKIPLSLNQAIEELQSTLSEVKTMTVNLQPGLSSTLEHLEETMAELAVMSARIEQWTAVSDDDMKEFMGDGLGQIPALVEDARATLREAQKLIRDIREDPSSLVYKTAEDSIEPEN